MDSPYLHTDIPPGMTLAEWSKQRHRPRTSLRSRAMRKLRRRKQA